MITDELREFIDGHLCLGQTALAGWKESAHAIADRIDAEYEEVLGSKVARAISVGEDGTEFVSMPAKELSECYMELPKDADGVPIRFGDKVTVSWNKKVYEVSGFSYTQQLASGKRTVWVDVYNLEKPGNIPLCAASSCRHYKPPTVQDVLEEMYNALEDARIPNGSEKRTYEEIITEYAAKLQLKEDI